MAEDKKNKEAKETDEIQGLDEGDLEESAAPKAEKPLIKRLMLPVGIAFVAIAVGLGAGWFLSSGDSEHEEATAQEDSSRDEHDNLRDDSDTYKESAKQDNHEGNASLDTSAETADAEYELTEEDMKEILWLDQLFSDIDTSKLMYELGMVIGDSELIEKTDIIAPQDSVDTLSWIEKETNKLNKYRDSLTKVEKDITKREQKIERAMLQINQAESSQIKNLARLYDGMRPEEATRLFQNLSDDIVISLIPRMKPANAAKILALMKPKRAARISTALITVMED